MHNHIVSLNHITSVRMYVCYIMPYTKQHQTYTVIRILVNDQDIKTKRCEYIRA